MILLITPQNAHRHANLFESIYRFRHRFFVEHMKWEALRRPDGLEIDQFDTERCIHVVGLENDQVISYTRLLPTTEPHLQSHVYPEMLDGAPCPTGPDIYEWTRCGVAPEKREGRKGTDPATAGIFTAVAEAAAFLGLKGIIVQTHPLLITRIIELGWRARPLALPTEIDGSAIVPVYAGVDESTVTRSWQVFDLDRPVLTIDSDVKPLFPENSVRVENLRHVS